MSLKKILDNFQAPMMVVNVSKGEKDFTPEKSVNASSLYLLLESYKPDFHYITSTDAVTAIMEFASLKKASLIIMAPKIHGFFDGLFHHSFTHKLAHHTNIPLLLVHEKAE